ncbi:unnamed protein product [Peronospora farinosa]|uniref:Uncharacterized protein n=1 Tax=Peronospora farinosa TaxID=134698 RepID=A0AAV0T0E0_9STRA|nr:unnamed protein product [Peronospora farinosa]CAI5711772.1 unnamed protein product [Peronospora farinosa]
MTRKVGARNLGAVQHADNVRQRPADTADSSTTTAAAPLLGRGQPPCRTWFQALNWGNEELSFNASSVRGDSENDATAGTSSSSMLVQHVPLVARTSIEMAVVPSNTSSRPPARNVATSLATQCHRIHGIEQWRADAPQQEKNLHAATNIYGVHFAALHRRVKKRAQVGHSSKGANGYFFRAMRSELLVNVTALRKLSDILVANARELMLFMNLQRASGSAILDVSASVPIVILVPVVVEANRARKVKKCSWAIAGTHFQLI